LGNRPTCKQPNIVTITESGSRETAGFFLANHCFVVFRLSSTPQATSPIIIDMRRILFCIAALILLSSGARAQSHAIQWTPFANVSGGVGTPQILDTAAANDSIWTYLGTYGTIANVEVYYATRFGPCTGGLPASTGLSADCPTYGSPYNGLESRRKFYSISIPGATADSTKFLMSQGANLAPAWTAAGAISTPVGAANGGTGATTLTAHGVMVGNSTGVVAVTAAGTAGQVLTSGGASANPGWTTSVPLANGGTGGTTIPTGLAGLGYVSPVALAADTATTVQTLVGCPTALQFTIGTAGTYRFHICLNVGNSGTNGTKIGLLLPTSATIKAFVNGNTSGVTAFTTDIISASTTAGANFNTSAISTALIFIDGTVTSGGTGGQVIVQFEATTSGTATVKAGSVLWVQRIL
jgi:hypothetical protein